METGSSLINNKSGDRTNWALGFMRTAYKDYIAARVLLNKGYTMQGVTLASTAIEKSFKAAICIIADKKIFGHIDKINTFRTILEDHGFGKLFELIDPRFLDILNKAYVLRYYDEIQSETTIGFFKNQFLGELDSAFSVFERLYNINNEKGEKILTPLQRDLHNQNPDLIENNWLALKMEKKKFMETGCEGFAIYIHPNNVYQEINVSSIKVNLPYEGSMMLINVKPDRI